ncbi:MAG: fructosamine kinase family protein [Gammaproteobacteria bacterium]|nr:fructosamine kinase family protein [Gammaproteobacteria bacterium]
MDRNAALAQALSRTLGTRCAGAPAQRVRGGCINECYAWDCDRGRLFVKLAPADAAPRLEREAAGLDALAAAQALRVPRVLGQASCAVGAYLVLEYIESGPARADTAARLGAGLARLHAHSAPRFGFEGDNYLGLTQANGWLADWPGFFRTRRLEPQLALAAARGHRALEEPGARLLECVPALLAGHQPQPALLHGDLWGGNWLSAADGTPVLVDPAVYFGDAEADLAMTRLFGGFAPAFYSAYAAHRPAAPGWQLRSELYNLYHLLNHANLFGGAYLAQALECIAQLRAACRA